MNEIPKGLVDIQPSQILDLFNCPSIIHLPGKDESALFLSIQLHGNEFSGLLVLQEVLRVLAGQELPRSLIIFVGNVHATAVGLRHLPDQPDFNRIWNSPQSAENGLAKSVKDFLHDRPLFAVVDIHNNTGPNPLYACVTELTKNNLYLASFFSKTVVFFETPDTVLVRDLNQYCPAVVLECGQPGTALGVERAKQMVLDLMHIKSLSSHFDPDHELSIYQSIGRITMDPATEFSYERNGGADLILNKELLRQNFVPIDAGFVFAEYSSHCSVPLDQTPIRIEGKADQDCTYEYLHFGDEVISLKKQAIPAMITDDNRVIRSDCLGYLMQNIKFKDKKHHSSC